MVANKSHFNQWALPTFPPKVLRKSFEKSYWAVSEHYRPSFEAGARTTALKQVLAAGLQRVRGSSSGLPGALGD